MDISEILFFWKFLTAPIVAWAIFRLVKRLRPAWLRITIRAGASILLACSLLAILFLAGAEAACSRRAPPLTSPDGRHTALRRYAMQGALGADFAIVSIRRPWIPWATIVYRAEGAWDFTNEKAADPELRWLDPTHLSVRHRFAHVLECNNYADGVLVTCDFVPPDPH
jgi:hypothetical protein